MTTAWAEASPRRTSARTVDRLNRANTVKASTAKITVQLEGTDYTVLRWQAVPAGGWEIDEGIELWDMEMF